MNGKKEQSSTISDVAFEKQRRVDAALQLVAAAKEEANQGDAFWSMRVARALEAVVGAFGKEPNDRVLSLNEIRQWR